MPGRTALAYARRYPAACARHYALGIAHAFGNLGTSAFAQALGVERVQVEMKAYSDLTGLGQAFLHRKTPWQKALGALVAAFLALTYGLTLWGGMRTVRRGELGAEGVLCLLLAAYFILLTGSAGEARFRLPALPFYLPFAGAGFAALSARRSS